MFHPSQDPLGRMGFRLNASKAGDIWARNLSGGDVALGAFNAGGGSPAGVTLLQQGAYCANATGVDNHSSFGYSLGSCALAVGKNKTCSPLGYFYYSEGYNGQCVCARDGCATRKGGATYSSYLLNASAPAAGLDITVDLAAVGKGEGGKSVSVFDIWAGKELEGSPFMGSFVAKNVAHHGTGFFRLKTTDQA